MTVSDLAQAFTDISQGSSFQDIFGIFYFNFLGYTYNMIIQFIANGIVSGSLIAIMAIGFSMIYSTTRVFHIAHGAVYTVGAYAFYTFAVIFDLPFVLSFLISIWIVILLGIFIEWLIYAPLNKRNASMGVVFISSLSVYILVVNLIPLFYGNETKVLSSSIEKSFNFGNVILTRIQVVQVFAFMVILLITTIFLKKTRAGKTFQAMSNNPLLLTVLGTNMNKMRLLVFALGSALAGIASILTAITFLLLIIFLLYKPEGIFGFRKRVEEI